MESHPTHPHEAAPAADMPAIDWVVRECGWRDVAIERLSGDASFRRYLRLYPNNPQTDESWILMISPPHLKEKNEEFCALAKLLRSLGVRAPEVRLWRKAKGWLLLTDFGKVHYWDHLRRYPDRAPQMYRQAIEVMLKIQRCPQRHLQNLPRLDTDRGHQESLLVKDWYCQGLLGVRANTAVWQRVAEAIHWLAERVAEQPKVLTHFDFHCRNLLIPPDGDMAVLDFQDAIAGPVALDPVSLLRDCYIELPKETVAELLEHYYRRAIQENILPPDTRLETLHQWFEQCSLQRHLRVLGTFARLHVRDGRSGYLQDLPLTLKYSLHACDRLAPMMAPVRDILAQTEPLLADLPPPKTRC